MDMADGDGGRGLLCMHRGKGCDPGGGERGKAGEGRPKLHGVFPDPVSVAE